MAANFKRNWFHYYSYAVCRGMKHPMAEDFAQEASLEVFNGRKTSTRNMFTDFIRKEFGRSDQKCHEERQKITRPILSGETIDHIPSGTNIEDLDLRLAARLKHLDTAERCVVVLTLGWGFSQKEVGYALGITSTRVSQIISTVYDRFEVDDLDDNA